MPYYAACRDSKEIVWHLIMETPGNEVEKAEKKLKDAKLAVKCKLNGILSNYMFYSVYGIS